MRVSAKIVRALYTSLATAVLAAGLGPATAPVKGEVSAQWARGPEDLPADCENHSQPYRTVQPGAGAIEITCGGLDRPALLRVRLTNPDSPLVADLLAGRDISDAWRPQEVLWAPDARALIVNGSESAHAGADSSSRVSLATD